MQVTDPVIDPVCGMTIESEKSAARETWQRQTYYFCSTSCQEKFRTAPDRYAKKVGDHAAHGSHSQ